ncbi:MAG: AAA family ATPase [Muribaculaceae bacterium]|nr:AAA family ATPase [Muribaculaceae bacterium]
MQNKGETERKDASELKMLSVIEENGVREFLAGSGVEGIGPAYARKLVDKFGIDAISVLRDRPLEALSIPGLGESRVMTASESIKKLKYDPMVYVFLYSCGVSDMYVNRIFGKYRRKAEKIVVENPYEMVEDVWQLSFFTADKIGRALGVAEDDAGRLQGALVTAVKQFSEAGNLFAPMEDAVAKAAEIAGVNREVVEAQIESVVASGRLVKSRGGLYLPVFYKAEREGAEKLAKLSGERKEIIEIDDIPRYSRHGHAYSGSQREAIRTLLNSKVAVLTGGPGTGKTTVLRGVIDILEREGKKVVLSAPTGKAAKRMEILTGKEASTIHRLLGYRQGEGYFADMIDADVLIIDEGSMMEQVLFNHLLQALRPSTEIILVGDVDQLPAIGAGDVMRDMIKSGVIPVAQLNENFRQDSSGMIASGARAINNGKMPEFDSESDRASDHLREFILIPEPNIKRIHARIIELMTKELPEKRGISASDIIVVTPQQIGPLGARQLNMDLQERLNPEGPALKRGGVTMRLGDPVMQTANSREKGVYNGETGVITDVDEEKQTLEVTWEAGGKSRYERSELSELVLGYATTVHKLQGSEVKNMIFPITMAHKPMLYRNLLYTGISRATQLCVLVGEEEALRYAVGNNMETRRNTNFANRLRENIDLSKP